MLRIVIFLTAAAAALTLWATADRESTTFQATIVGFDGSTPDTFPSDLYSVTVSERDGRLLGAVDGGAHDLWTHIPFARIGCDGEERWLREATLLPLDDRGRTFEVRLRSSSPDCRMAGILDTSAEWRGNRSVRD